MNCSICGKSDKTLEVFNIAENGVITCMECLRKPKEFKDNVRILKVAEERIVNVYYVIQEDEDGDYKEEDRVYITEEDQNTIDRHEMSRRKVEELPKDHFLQKAMDMLRRGEVTNTEDLFK